MKQAIITTTKGTQVVATIYEAEKNKVLIIASATGVKQTFYQKFAEFIAEKGLTVITFDYSGIGRTLQASKKTVKATQTDIATWGKNDLEAIIQYVQQHYPSAKITLLGHSIGGQIVGLAKSSLCIQKIILIAAQSGYWKLWKGKDKIKMWLNWHLVFPVLLTLFGYLPSKKIMGMENLPKGVAKQWSGWGRKPNYLFDEIAESELFHHQITTNITSISIEHDFYAPKEAVDELAQKYTNAKVKRMHLTPKAYNVNELGHFGIFRTKFRENVWLLLWNEIDL